MKNTFKKEIEDFLFSKYDAKKSSDIWVNIKCPYCDANSSKRHFYVCMDDIDLWCIDVLEHLVELEEF